MYYDGKSLTLYEPAAQYYATVPAPATLDAMLDAAQKPQMMSQTARFAPADASAFAAADASDGLLYDLAWQPQPLLAATALAPLPAAASWPPAPRRPAA